MRTLVRERFVGKPVVDVGRPRRRESLVSSFTTGMVDVVSGGSAHTKGASFTQLTGAAALDADGFFLQLEPAGASNDYLLDLAIGASSSEVVIVSNLLICAPGFGSFEAWDVYVPLPIRAGTRVSAKVQSTLATQTLRVGLTFCRGEQYRRMRMRRATTYGANTGDSGGTAVDPGGVANTKGSYAAISAAVTNPIRYAILCHGNVRNGARTDATTLFDVAVGPNPNEVVKIADLYLRLESATDMVRPAIRGRFLDVRRGQRLAARASCSTTDATDRLTDLVVIGFD